MKRDNKLELLGFNSYESSIIVVLMTGEPFTVKQIYEKTKIPKNKIYETLEHLKSKGIIAIENNKPKKYFLINNTIFDDLIFKKQEKLEKLKIELEELKIIQEKINPDVLAISEGNEEVHRLVEHSNRIVKQEILSCSRLSKMYYGCYRTLKDAIARGVKARFVTLDTGKNFKVLKAYYDIGVELRIYNSKKSDFPKIGLFDEKFTRITIWPQKEKDPKKFKTIWANSPLLYKIVKAHFDNIWNNAIPFDPKTFKR
jgi:sugar-specific transcriptional regulator TrmB